MKPLHFKIPKTSGESVRIQYDEQRHFYENLHFHPELQIMVICESTGTRFIGDSIGSFKAGDIVVLGSNLPHVFRNDKKYYEPDSELKATNISVFVDLAAFENNILSLPEAHALQKLLLNSKRGLRIRGETKRKVAALIQEMRTLNGFEKIIQILIILNLLSHSHEVEMLSSVGFNANLNESDNRKINDVFSYIMNNFSEDIKLTDAANVANMSVNAFCRYFKQHTQKTFSQFLNEIRIGHACRLLIEDKWNIRETAFECGYDNISYFNRQFKDITNLTPTEFVKLHHTRFTNEFSLVESVKG
ncbi:AraC family transcriptional regulator [Rufibacter sediminis]|uniref:Helix-turn-helix transcriptional regulator n=1 Tax=Rufibacter sediminis TaxID=2762756 RepID=A0ABR6VSG2_9BACT|nr:AraC family transcriptional regulator [Rufibacter sediminis]MBC3540133.1 helix-turn-helix transcriptional regulator [Rufibacter sediminis]